MATLNDTQKDVLRQIVANPELDWDVVFGAIENIVNETVIHMNAALDQQVQLVGELTVDRNHWRKTAVTLYEGVSKLDHFQFNDAMEDVKSHVRSEELKVRAEERKKRMDAENERIRQVT